MLAQFTDEQLLKELISRHRLDVAPWKRQMHDFVEVVVGIGADEIAYVTLTKDAHRELFDAKHD